MPNASVRGDHTFSAMHVVNGLGIPWVPRATPISNPAKTQTMAWVWVFAGLGMVCLWAFVGMYLSQVTHGLPL